VSKATRICALIFLGYAGAYSAAIFDSYLIGTAFSFVFGWNVAAAHKEMNDERV